tara:strand:- start:513 stop:968 length:456 start_codon:yes stop_codon:yes gene_type:complete
MANIEEIRRFRLQEGKLPVDIGVPINYKAEEFKWIPFLGNNPTGEKAQTYKGMFSFSHEETGQTKIDCNARRVNGVLEITISGDERTAGYFGVAAHRFAEAIFDTTERSIKGTTEEVLESEVESLKRELSRAHDDKQELEDKLNNFRKMLE